MPNQAAATTPARRTAKAIAWHEHLKDPYRDQKDSQRQFYRLQPLFSCLRLDRMDLLKTAASPAGTKMPQGFAKGGQFKER